MHVVSKPFPWSPDGVHIEQLQVGAERDFGELAPGLVGAGYITAPGLPPGSGNPAAAADLRSPPSTSNASGAQDAPVEIPENWHELHHATKKKLAREISGQEPADTAAAEAVIEAEIARRTEQPGS
ncbi:hypothetical protein NVS89_22515 [Ancylobacter sp. MQZ15Z-1]|uniref:Uncharacterized protein n=1 Tax=Ancylobacter mangrovi TaxID=2972472 RepID=A0A9X2PKB1_9HYPH|nr:hypothetical protein [Ancylobacter mangrovi]MCS0497868.1 hypothetical protein [Ancylobacter mangrovi]